MHDAILNGAVVDAVDGRGRIDGSLVDAPFNNERSGGAGIGVPNIVGGIEHEGGLVAAGVGFVGDAAAFKVAVFGPVGGRDDDEVIVGVVDKVGGAIEVGGLDRQLGDGPRNLDLIYPIRRVFPLVVRGVDEGSDSGVAAGIGGVGVDDGVLILAAVGDDADLVGEVVDESIISSGLGDGLAANAPGDVDGVARRRRIAVRPLAVAMMDGADGGGGGVVAGEGGVGGAAEDIEIDVGRIIDAVLRIAGIGETRLGGRAHQDALGDGEGKLLGIGGAVGPSAVDDAGGIVERRGNGVGSNGHLLFVAQGVVTRGRGHRANLLLAVVDEIGSGRHLGRGNDSLENLPVERPRFRPAIVLPPKPGLGHHRKSIIAFVGRNHGAGIQIPVAALRIRIDGGKRPAGEGLRGVDGRRNRGHQKADDDNAAAAGRTGRVAAATAAATTSTILAGRGSGSIIRSNTTIATTTLATGMRRCALGPTAAAAAGVVQQGTGDVALETNATATIRRIAARRTSAAATGGLAHVVASATTTALPRGTGTARMLIGIIQTRTATT